MRFLLPAILGVITVFLLKPAYSQDKIYQSTSPLQGEISEVTANKIVFTPEKKNAKPVTLDTKNVVLLFNKEGDFLIPSKIDFKVEESKKQISDFINPGTSAVVKDYIFTREKKKLEGDFLKEDKNFIYYSLNGSTVRLDRKTVAAIIFKDGHHSLYIPAKDAADILWNTEQEIKEAIAAAERQKAEEAARLEEQKKQEAALKAAANETRQKTFEDLAPNISRKDFEDKAMSKMKQFNNYLKVLCDKSATNEDVNQATSLALLLFIDENVIVETSTTRDRNNVRSKKIRAYLTDVRMLKYDRIELEWTKVHYVTNVKLGPDGLYYGTVTFEQVFKGYRDGQLIYSDVTQKDAVVVLKTYSKNVEGTVQQSWDVLLGDIAVTSTKDLAAN